MTQNQDAGASSIMVGAQSGITCEEQMDSIPSAARSVSTADAQKAGECVHKDLGNDPGGIFTEYTENGECWNVYLVTEYWWCEWDTQTLQGYCSHLYDDWSYQYTSCEPPY